MRTARDVLVIGGGINGVAIAYHLARRGASVALVEKESICAGPTARCCGIVRQHYSHAVTARMALAGLEVFESFDDVVGGECDFHRTGFLLTAREETADMLRANVALQRSVGIDTRVLAPDEIRAIEPHADLEGIVAGAYEPRAGYADPYATTMAYAARAAELGVEMLTGRRVVSIDATGERVTGVTTPTGKLAAGAVVLAAGPWAGTLLGPLGITLPIATGRVQVGLFDRPREVERHGILCDTSLGVYSRPEGDLMLVGSLETSDAQMVVDDPDYFNEEIDFDRVESYAERIVRRYPAMQAASFHGGYASLYDITTDWQPVLGALPGYDGLYCAIGSSGHGFKLAPVVGELVASLVVGEPSDSEALELFSPGRFAAGALADGRYSGHKILA
jgi:sarcosine oxidase subunit beta